MSSGTKEEIKGTCECISFFRRNCLKFMTNELESWQTPIQTPFKKTLSVVLIDDRETSANFSIPQEINLSNIGSAIFELTIAVTDRFLTSPQFSPSGVERKHNLPQYEGFLHTDSTKLLRDATT